MIGYLVPARASQGLPTFHAGFNSNIIKYIFPYKVTVGLVVVKADIFQTNALFYAIKDYFTY